MPDELKHFTQQAQTALMFTQAAAEVPDNDAIQPEHLLLGLLQVPDSPAFEALAKFDVTYQRVSSLLCVEMGGRARPAPELKRLSDSIKQVLTRAFMIARAHSQSDVGTEHLLLALLDSPDAAISGVFGELSVDLAAVQRELETHLKTN